MATQTDLNALLDVWRRRVRRRGLDESSLDELESHLLEEIDRLAEGRRGLTQRQIFFEALARLGQEDLLAAEFHKVRPDDSEPDHPTHFRWRMDMFHNYLLTAYRNLLRSRGFTLLNVAGLTLGMTCCLLLFQYAAYETSFDTFHTRKDRLYRSTLLTIKDGEDAGYGVEVGVAFGPTMAGEVPGIRRFARVHPNYGDAVLTYREGPHERTFVENRVFYVDSTFFNLFDFPLVRGDRASALRSPSSILLSESMTRKYFGDEDPLGRSVQFAGWTSGPYMVSGVFRDVPPVSHLQFDVLLPLEALLQDGRFDRMPWNWQNFITYFELEPSAVPHSVERGIAALYRKHRQEDLANTAVKSHLQPITDIHLNSTIQGGTAYTGSRRSVYFFTLVGLATFIIALINYLNLATARAMDRAREVGVRKTLGARKPQLVGQFLVESLLVNGLALVLANGLSITGLPFVNRLAEIQLDYDLWIDLKFWAVVLGLFVTGVVLSGWYPSFVLSSYPPIAVLKGRPGTTVSRTALRKILVVVQFAASTALLAGTAIVYRQLQYMRTLDTGVDLEQVLVIDGPRVQAEGHDLRNETATLKKELERLPSIRLVGLSATTPGRGAVWYTARLRKSTDDPASGQPAGFTEIDADFLRVYGLTMAAGEPFREGNPGGTKGHVLVNETLVRSLGFPSNTAAVGQTITTGGEDVFLIQGVLKDFRWSSAHQKAESIVFFHETNRGNLSLKVQAGDMPRTIAAAERLYKKLLPGNPFTYRFADAAFDEQYRSDRRFARLFGLFTGVAIGIACLGLFGLASFATARRTKEIGVRKVLGASTGSIVGLVTKDFLFLVGLAFLVATPAAYVYMNDWLNAFAYRIELGPGLFVQVGLLALLIALLTVSFQAVRAASTDPVKSLRYE